MPGDLSKIYKRIGATRATINFLTRCRKFNLSPKGFLSKSRISTTKSNQMELRFSRIRIRDAQYIARKTVFIGSGYKGISQQGNVQVIFSASEENPRQGIFHKDEDIQLKVFQYDGNTARQNTSWI